MDMHTKAVICSKSAPGRSGIHGLLRGLPTGRRAFTVRKREEMTADLTDVHRRIALDRHPEVFGQGAS
jgi:hypothetical protein